MTRTEVLAALARLGRTTRVNGRTGQIAILNRAQGKDAPIFVTVHRDALELGLRPDAPGRRLAGPLADDELAAALVAISAPDAG